MIGEEDQDDLSGVEAADSGTQFEMDESVLQKQLPDPLNAVSENRVRETLE